MFENPKRLINKLTGEKEKLKRKLKRLDKKLKGVSDGIGKYKRIA